MTEPLRVLFVCTANISRSPYAEWRARQILGDAPVLVASAGTPGYPGHGLDPAMLVLLQQRGAEGESHVSRSVDDDVLAWADLVFTVEFGQRMRLFDTFPGHAPKVFGLRQFAETIAVLDAPGAGADLVAQVARQAVPDSVSLDIDDPHGRGRDAAASCADELDALLDLILPALAGRALPSIAPVASEPRLATILARLGLRRP